MVSGLGFKALAVGLLSLSQAHSMNIDLDGELWSCYVRLHARCTETQTESWSNLLS